MKRALAIIIVVLVGISMVISLVPGLAASIR